MNQKGMDRSLSLLPKFSILLQTILVVTIGFPLLSLILFPIFLLREIVKFYGIHYKELDSMVTGYSTMFASVDDIYGDKVGGDGRILANIVMYVVVDGEVSLDQIRERTLEKGFVKLADGSLKYKQLQLYPEWFLGYLFFKREKEFDIKNHIRAIDRPIRNEEELLELFHELHTVPWARKRSLWEAILVPQYGDSQKSVLFTRHHHSLMDGLSAADFVYQDIGNGHLQLPTINFPTPTTFQKILWYSLYPFLGTYQLLDQISQTNDNNVLHVTGKRASGKRHVAFCDAVPLKLIKEVKLQNKVSFDSVISATICAGIRNYLKDSGMEIPPFIHTFAIYPYPAKVAGVLENHFTTLVGRLPVGLSDMIERLQQIEYFSSRARTSTLPQTSVYFSKLIGSTPAPIVGLVADNLSTSTVLVSNVAISTQPVDFLGLRVLDVVAAVGPAFSHNGVAITSVSYNGNLRMVVMTEQSSIATLDQCKTIARYISDEYYALEKSKKD